MLAVAVVVVAAVVVLQVLVGAVSRAATADSAPLARGEFEGVAVRLRVLWPVEEWQVPWEWQRWWLVL